MLTEMLGKASCPPLGASVGEPGLADLAYEDMFVHQRLRVQIPYVDQPELDIDFAETQLVHHAHPGLTEIKHNLQYPPDRAWHCRCRMKDRPICEPLSDSRTARPLVEGHRAVLH